jgi:tetratricopeptide (TPR) repeat protein
MEGLAEPGTALLTASTLALVEEIFEVRPLGPMSVKGLEQPIPVYEVVGTGAAKSRLHAAAARGLTRFVGRDDERASVERALARARSGQGQVVALVGEPGIGKSRLVWEVTHAAEAAGWTVLHAGAASYGMAVPYLPLVDLLRAYCRIEPSDRAEVVGEKVRERLARVDPALGPSGSPLLALLDVPVEDAAWQALDPPGRRRATLDAVARLLLRESRERPLLLVIEDLHWLDSESQALLDELVESLPGASTALLVNYRPEYTHAWGNRSHYTQLRIDALGQAGAEELLAALLGADASIRPLTALLIERTEGNPFFLEESVRTLVETGVLVGERGAYRLVRAVEEIRVPATVQAVLAARIDRLPAEEKRLLQTAAVIGKDVPYALLMAVAQTSNEVLHATLSRLQAAELLYPVNLFPEPEYTFKHALTHDVAYGSLLQDRRKSLHARIVTAIESLYPDHLEEHVERLAHHATCAEQWEQAAFYARQAGRKGLNLSSMREAATWFEQGRAALDRLPSTREVLEQSIDVRIDLRAVLNPLGELGRAFEYLREARFQAELLDDRDRLGRVSVSMANFYWLTGGYDRAISAAQNALTIGNELGDLALQAAARNALGQSYLRMGDHREAVACQRRTLQLLEQTAETAFLGTSTLLHSGALLYLAWSLGELGSFDEALQHGETAIQAADQSGHAFSVLSGAFSLGRVCVLKGDVERAITVLERGLAVCRAANLQTLGYHGVAGFLGEAYVLAGRSEEALAMLEQVATHSLELGVVSDHFVGAVPLIEVYLTIKRHDDALHLATRTVDLASRHAARGYLGWSLRSLARVHARHEPPEVEQAEHIYRQSLALAEELGMRPLQAHCHLGLGKLYRQVGRFDEARAELATSVAMLREMGMVFWLREAEAELAQSTASHAGPRSG